VVDGYAYDAGEKIILGVTVGTRIQYTQLLAVGLMAGQVKIVSLRTISGYTNVLLVTEELLLCAVKEGDDTYPYAIKLGEPEGTSYKLTARCMINNQGLPLALAQSLARAATVCDGYLVLVMDRTIEIFSVSDFTNGGTSGDVKPISSIPLYTPASNIRRAIAKAAFQIRGDESGVLHLSMRGNFGTLNIASLFRESDSAGGAPSFDLKWAQFSGGSEIDENDQSAPFFSLGPSAAYQIDFSLVHYSGSSLLDIFLVKIQKAGATEIPGQRAHIPSVRHIDGSNLPLRQFTTSLDFDDSTGLVLFGTSKGEIVIAYFQAYAALARRPDWLQFELPELPVNEGCDGLSTVHISMYIPAYYECRGNLNDAEPSVLRRITSEAINSWGTASLEVQLPPSWSSNWEQYDHVLKWIRPTPRWSPSVFQFYPRWDSALDVRRMTSIRGELIPLVYYADGKPDSQLVVFRVGVRLYITLIRNDPGEGDAVNIGALPFRFDQPLDLTLLDEFAHSIIPLSNFSSQRHGDECVDMVDLVARETNDLLEYLAANPHELLDLRHQTGENPELWSEDDWRLLTDGRREASN